MLSVEARTESILVLACVFLWGPAAAEEPKKEHSRAIGPVPACEARKDRRFNVLFEHVDIEKMIQTMADVTCRTFIVPDTVKGKISIIGPDEGKGKIDAEHLYSAFLAALDANGLTVLQSGDFLRLCVLEQIDADLSLSGQRHVEVGEQLQDAIDGPRIAQNNELIRSLVGYHKRARARRLRPSAARLVEDALNLVGDVLNGGELHLDHAELVGRRHVELRHDFLDSLKV